MPVCWSFFLFAIVGEFVRNIGWVFAVLFEVPFNANPRGNPSLCCLGRGYRGTQKFWTKFVNKLALRSNTRSMSVKKESIHRPAPVQNFLCQEKRGPQMKDFGGRYAFLVFIGFLYPAPAWKVGIVNHLRGEHRPFNENTADATTTSAEDPTAVSDRRWSSSWWFVFRSVACCQKTTTPRLFWDYLQEKV